MSIQIVNPFDWSANSRLVRWVELGDQHGEAGVTRGRREPPVDVGVNRRVAAHEAMRGGHSDGTTRSGGCAGGSIVRREKGLLGSQIRHSGRRSALLGGWNDVARTGRRTGRRLSGTKLQNLRSQSNGTSCADARFYRWSRSVHLHDRCRTHEHARADAASVGSAARYRPGPHVGRSVRADVRPRNWLVTRTRSPTAASPGDLRRSFATAQAENRPKGWRGNRCGPRRSRSPPRTPAKFWAGGPVFHRTHE